MKKLTHSLRLLNTIRRYTVLGILWFGHFHLSAENGYDLWLRYGLIENTEVLEQYRSRISTYYISESTATSEVMRQELDRAFRGLLGSEVGRTTSMEDANVLLVLASKLPGNMSVDIDVLAKDGFTIQTTDDQIIIVSKTQVGLLYGAFHFIRLLQGQRDISKLSILENPKIDIRILNHWDNLDRTSERGYAGFSIWDWHRLPDYLDPRYTDYARANASIGINAVALTNVNANALILTPMYLEKVKALADLFRPYGIRVYLTGRFSAPIEIGDLGTADPLSDSVQEWWSEKAKEIYSYVPDFGGFLVKANSEGQPGPQDYERSHADGANMLARAVQPHGGVVMWRAFVYSNEQPDDRAKQAYNEFKPLDGSFEDNVLIQVKNGPIDFQPREPFHPLFGAMPQTPLMMEFQITQEYLGQATQWVYLGPMWEEILTTDTYQQGEGSTVARVVDGTMHKYSATGIAGVANIGNDINWTGHPMAQANWFAFGKLAWNPQASSSTIADEWIRATYGNNETVVSTIADIMMSSWDASVAYMTPLGLHHLMGTSHHYGPAPWVRKMRRADWTPYYYHKSDENGIGFDRSTSGSNAVEQYAETLEKVYGDIDQCPEEFLLWFHHADWDHPMKSGRTLWEELGFKYQEGINSVREMQQQWNSLETYIDSHRFTQVKQLLTIQEKEAIWWKDACMLYFQTFSESSWPATLEPAQNTLEYYQSQRFPYAPGIRPRW